MTSSAPVVMPHLVLDNTMGAQLIGVLLAATLYGVSCIQTWYYYGWYPNDRWQLRVLVTLCWIFDTCHQALISHTIYVYLVQNFDNPAELGNLVWSLLVEVLFNGFTALLVQSFYAFRIYRLSGKNVWLTSVVVLLITAEFVAVVVYTAQALRLETFVQLVDLKHLSMAVNVLAAAGDVLIAAILCTMLHVSRTGFKKSDTMINKLIMFAVNTGLLTSICAVGSLVSIVAWPNAFIYICFYFSLGRLYANSLLATLNARKSIRGMTYDTEGFSVSLPTAARATAGGSYVIGQDTKNTLRIQVETTRECVHDDNRRITFRVMSDPGLDTCGCDMELDSQFTSDMPYTPDNSPTLHDPSGAVEKDIIDMHDMSKSPRVRTKEEPTVVRSPADL